MTTIELFDGQSCCGPAGDADDTARAVAQFVADADWLAGHDVVVARLTLSSDPLAFAMNTEVAALLQREGAKGLPAVALDGRVVTSGRYPTRGELAQLCGIDDDGADPAPAPAASGSGCCGGGEPAASGCCGGPTPVTITTTDQAR